MMRTISKGFLAVASMGFAFAACSATAATLQNGDFSSDLDGWDVVRCSFLCGADTTNSSAIVNGDGNDPYLELRAPLYRSAGQIEARQTVTIDASTSFLSFDVGLTSIVNDVQIADPTSITDYFTLLIQDDAYNLYSLFVYDVAGAREAALNEIDGLSIGETDIPNMSGAVSGYNLQADLSQFIGEDITLFFTVVSKRDNKITSFGIDNVALSGTPVSVVPLPAGAVLLLTALTALAGTRRMRARTPRA